MNKAVCTFGDIADIDATIIGGKAANLAKMYQADLPVPEGIVVGLDAFDENGELVEDAQQAIKGHLKAGHLYAVRSSAVEEDADNASWAGQFETYLNNDAHAVIKKVALCHASAKARVKAYARRQMAAETFDIAVVIQEMVHSEYAGVLFTKDPVTDDDVLVTEYVSGLGEALVSGKTDPKRVVIQSQQQLDAPFDIQKLAELARKVEHLFGGPQDIEWAWSDNKMWLIQARPITTKQAVKQNYRLGDPVDLFYWGPSRAKPIYMSDFMAAIERLFMEMAHDPLLPKPPKTVVLFYEGKMVWLNNAQAFADFTRQTFEAYEKLRDLDKDIDSWRACATQLVHLTGEKLRNTLVDAWYHTELAEFSLYGAETLLTKRLSRFDSQTRQAIWHAFTVPDKPTFLTQIDAELMKSRDAEHMAQKYPWIADGYDGVSTQSVHYFTERLKNINGRTQQNQDYISKRQTLIDRLHLTEEEIAALTLARRLAEFMDDRKAWMMQTRRLMTQSVSSIEHGWFYEAGTITKINQGDTRELWLRYIDFKASNNTVSGIVASDGGKHFIDGEVRVVDSPTDIIEDNKIIVVPSTSPSYVPLMSRAKALITDHGGMMSHAAIVAREFNLPCIVGTKQATKLLKNGDTVVLDLATGEVSC